MIQNLTSEYSRKKTEIKNRLKEFKALWRQTDERVFSELCFCICTPQSRAIYCDRAVAALEKSGILFRGGLSQIREGLKAVRFPNNKAGYIIEARELFITDGVVRIKEKIDTGDVLQTRKWIVENVKGIGYKEASHFLRNIGLGRDLAVLDVHILRNMIKYGIIREMPKSISTYVYLFMEGKLKKFSREINIPLEELDLLFWSSETGQIFK